MTQININFIPFLPRSRDIYLVGGTVRDLLLKETPEDYDIVTLNDPKALAGQIAKRLKGRVIELGKPGMTVQRVIAGRKTIDISPARGGSIRSDLKKRDFTVNALAASAADGRIIDLQNGIKDIHDRKIRMVCQKNLIEDPVRLLRAYRIAACLGFSIEPETRNAISRTAPRIYESAGERIRDELLKLLGAPDAFSWLAGMEKTGLLSEIFPEIRPLKHCIQNRFHRFDVFTHTITAGVQLEKIIRSPRVLLSSRKAVLRFFEKNALLPLLKYALLLHDIGKPRTKTVDHKGNIHFYTHEAVGAAMASIINRRLRFSNRECQYITFIIRNHLRPLFLFSADQKNRLTKRSESRFFLKYGDRTCDLLVHALADARGKGDGKKAGAFLKFVQNMLESYFDKFLPASSDLPVISGHDLINELGLSPSPLFARILTHVKEECTANNIKSREDALDIARSFLKLHPPP